MKTSNELFYGKKSKKHIPVYLLVAGVIMFTVLLGAGNTNFILYLGPIASIFLGIYIFII